MGPETELISYIRSQFAPDNGVELSNTTDLVGNGVLDSTAMMQLVLWIEETYQFPVELEDISPETFGTVQRLAEYVKRRSASLRVG